MDQSRSGEPTVLIVEDDADIQLAITDMFQIRGFHVAVVGNAAEAANYLEDHERPAVVLVDLLMPGALGMSLLDYMRHDARFSSIPVAIISASPQLAPEGYRVFRKPLDLKAVIEFVRAACDLAKQQRGMVQAEAEQPKQG